MAETSSESRPLWLSDQLVRAVQLVFAVVIAQSLTLYREILIDPVSEGHNIAALALFALYLTAIWSWIGWHAAMSRSPYIYRNDDGTTNWSEQLRVFADVAVVFVYAYVLFRIESFKTDPSANIGLMLIGYPAIFLLYLASGRLRVLRYGRSASRGIPLTVGLLMFLLLASVYYVVRPCVPSSTTANIWLNGVALCFVIVAMMLYRLLNEWVRIRYESGSIRK
jgi:hypothetical protein